MKLSRIFASLIALTVLFVSCEKQNVGPEGNSPKSVTITLSNVTFTKSVNEHLELANNKVSLVDARIFFTDGTNFYPAKTVDGNAAAVQYITDFEAPALDFHFLDTRVNRVIVVGNMGADFNPANLDALKKAVLDIEANQNPDYLPLYGESVLTAAGAISETHGSTLWTATVSLAPHISRIEIAGFGVNFDLDKYNKIEINQVALSNFYKKNQLDGGSLTELFKVGNTASDINNNFTANVAAEAAWYWDNPNVVLVKPETGTVVEQEAPTNLAYNIFCPASETLTPESDGYVRLDLQIVGTDVNGNQSPLYLYTKGFNKAAEGDDVVALSSFEPGKIYRIEPLTFNESDLEEHLKCVTLTVDVIQWSVVPVTPVW